MWVKKGRCRKNFLGMKSALRHSVHTIFVGPELDHCLSYSVTHILTQCFCWDLNDATLACEDARIAEKIHVFQNVCEWELRGEVHKAEVAGEGNLWGSVAGCLQCERQVLSSLWNQAFITLCISYALLTNAFKGLTLWRSCLRWGGSRRRKTPTWPRLNIIQFNSHNLNTILFNTVETSIFSGQYFVQLQSCQYSEVWIEFKHCYWW